MGFLMAEPGLCPHTRSFLPPLQTCPRPLPHPGLLGEVGEVLGDLGNEGQSACSAVIRVLLQETEEGRGHDGRTEEPEEQGGTDQSLADVWAASVAAFLSP